jgi:D-lyxose ketol-isomerase
MKRSEINQVCREAEQVFADAGWALPPRPRWDVTDFGLGDFPSFGLVLINLAEEPEYCEKLMYARKRQVTPAHTHRVKKEDIICRRGQLQLDLWPGLPDDPELPDTFTAQVNGEVRTLNTGTPLILEAGERITLVPGIYHAFHPVTDGCVIGEVSTANDDENDNFFVNPDIGRFPGIDEDEPAAYALCSDAPEDNTP